MLRKSYNGEDYCIYGIENQSHINRYMPIRVITYDGLRYLKEARKSNKELHPIITVVFYTGEDTWDKNLTFIDNIKIPEKAKFYFAGFKILIARITDDYFFQTKKLNEIFKLAKCIYNKEKIDHRFENIDVESVRLVGILTNSKELKNFEGKGEINMCRAWDERIQEIEKRGIKIGEERGIKIGEKRGEKRGKKKDRIELIQKAAKKLSIQEIADLFDFDVSYVQSILNNQTN